MKATYGSRPIRRRRARADMDCIRQTIQEVLEEIQPATVRQVFYQLVGRGAVAKSETEYKSTVIRLLTEMRRAGEIPFGWIADSTRWMRKPRSFSSLGDMLTQSQRFYRRAVWDDQDAHVEVWLEKDALAGVLYDVTSEFDVPLMVTRGYPSLSYLYDAAEAIAGKGKPAFLYYFGDYDPSGLDITRTVERGIREFAPDSEIHLERLAVTREQIEWWSLPTRPTKKTDTRSKNFVGESVEVDSIPPDMLRNLVRNRILWHIDPRQMEMSNTIEKQEQATLARIVAALPAMAGGSGGQEQAR